MSTEPELTAVSESAEPAPIVETLVDRERRNPFYRYLMHLGLPLTFSLAIHLGVVGFLAIKVIRIAVHQTADVDFAGAVVNKDNIPSAFSWQNQPTLEAQETPPEEPVLNLNDFKTNDTSLTDLGKNEGEGKGEGDGFGLGDGELKTWGTGAGAGDSGAGGWGAGGGGGSRIGQAGIWDLNVRANKVVYVVDYSGSLVVAVDDLKKELKRSIGKLKPSQSFNVILFYSTIGAGAGSIKTEGFKGKLEAATPDTRKDFFGWIDKKAPQGDTEPMQAIRRALDMRPEAVFFLSDGLFDDKVVTEIAEANEVARAHIYTLVFDELYLKESSGLPPKEGEGCLRMKRIAEANGGKTKIVTGKDLAK